eukprot:CAMPEP_0117670910 /NCGR_PEP_ID=MMETSP0804-20121206/13033_1 /TAXON_ID=1074897 /ORGANISM="Tetraselmis astigmatica, Strain CCMP880" /LENGTH=236 /DNA_ID=CAMNT_0005479297 /DNA_START=1205 /DNA_END=1912 /DNA_ORIENTATION=+
MWGITVRPVPQPEDDGVRPLGGRGHPDAMLGKTNVVLGERPLKEPREAAAVWPDLRRQESEVVVHGLELHQGRHEAALAAHQLEQDVEKRPQGNWLVEQDRSLPRGCQMRAVEDQRPVQGVDQRQRDDSKYFHINRRFFAPQNRSKCGTTSSVVTTSPTVVKAMATLCAVGARVVKSWELGKPRPGPELAWLFMVARPEGDGRAVNAQVPPRERFDAPATAPKSVSLMTEVMVGLL